jgi:LacI family transcriptional regulator
VLSNLEELPDLFFCANDSIAIDTMNILQKLGKSIPEDVMICGFDDSEESRHVSPTLTTVHIHTQSMAYVAAQMLISRIREPILETRTVYLNTDLIRRESTRLRTGNTGN